MNGTLLDTSFVIAAGDGDAVFPDDAAISVITLGELRAGVLRAGDAAERAVRARRLSDLRSLFVAFPVDEAVAERYGWALARARDAGRGTDAADLLIVATAAATDTTLHTRDVAQAKLARRLGLVVHGPAAA
ncbi:MAG TPA: type II toxin-antitoxin system VapC family toxin [Conexibacter sp.]|nr:type II toxin-antitoxin system VapC family toxin [Conexibacter sp.]